MDYWKIIKAKVKCCLCEGPLVGSLDLNIVTPDRIAKWPMPTVSNAYIPNEPLQAIAIICDRCLETGTSGKPHIEYQIDWNESMKYVIEWTENLDSVTYHLVEDLDLLPITQVARNFQLLKLGGPKLLLKKVYAAFYAQYQGEKNGACGTDSRIEQSYR